MRLASYLATLTTIGFLPFTISCVHTNSMAEEQIGAHRYKDLVFVAFVNDSDLLLTTRTVEVVLFSEGIHPDVEGWGGGNDISVRKKDAYVAVTAIANNPELQGHGIWINKAFWTNETTNFPEVKMGNETWLDLSKTQTKTR